MRNHNNYVHPASVHPKQLARLSSRLQPFAEHSALRQIKREQFRGQPLWKPCCEPDDDEWVDGSLIRMFYSLEWVRGQGEASEDN